MRLFIVTVFMMSATSMWTQAQYGMPDSGLPDGLLRGEFVEDFTVRSATDGDLTLSKLLEDGPVALLFYRGNWSEECIAHLRNFQDSLGLLSALQVVAISPESAAELSKTQNLVQAEYRLGSDKSGQVMEILKVAFPVSTAYSQQIMGEKGVNIARHNGSEEAVLPITATFLISHNQEIFWRHVHYDPAQRAGVTTVLEAIKPRH